MEEFKIFSHIGYSKDEKPFWIINKPQEATASDIVFGEDIYLEFNTRQRFCIGWHDLETGENHPCPDHATLEPKYEQCQKCQGLTGFNAAFYNADSVSEVQQRRNAQPHFVYLAYFSPNFTKVGISYAGRGFARLLEQGARQAIILETFNSALVARQYEAEIGHLNKFVENVKISKKIELLSESYDSESAKESLLKAKTEVEQALKTEFKQSQWLDLDAHYFIDDFDKSRLSTLADLTGTDKITGKIVGLVGSTLLCDYQNTVVALPLKKLTGYPFTMKNQIGEIELPNQQFSLF
ncbi:MAG: DUF2797 domain-containing protein [Candidatus Saccharibacteria bacterium]|nr:DUF2797 domain-containing protein [Candidatus Saccharibacteria bacterium]